MTTPTDVSSQVFTFTPDDGLDGGTTYTVSFDATGATDANGVGLLPVEPLKVVTAAAPGVVKFRPVDGGSTTDPNQVISVRFTAPMNKSTTAASLSIVMNGNRLRGVTTWAENNTVLVFDPASKLTVNATVYIRISATAKSATGQRLSKAVSASFKVKEATVTTFKWAGGGVASKTSPWHASEIYYLNLMNCTRTGRWVLRSGACSSASHHTLPAQDALACLRADRQCGCSAVLPRSGHPRRPDSLPQRDDTARADVCGASAAARGARTWPRRRLPAPRA